MTKNLTLLDCTLRDGGYYNSWNFSSELVAKYLNAMQAANVDIVELGFRSLNNSGFKGAYAFTTDEFVRTLNVPSSLQIGVMINGNELTGNLPYKDVLQQLFPNSSENSPVSLVRIACHVHEFEKALPASKWLKARGFQVGFNLMQVADRSEKEIKELAHKAKEYPIDSLYFADSMGSMQPTKTAQIIQWLRSEWDGPLGIHTHDNLGLALSNTLCAIKEGVTWIDSTVTGMGRGPGNARTEELAIEVAEQRNKAINLAPLMTLLHEHFKPMQAQYGWGTNPYYYLAGKYGIHPTYVQEMLNDSRFTEEDMLAVIDYLRSEGGKSFNLSTLDAARHFYQGKAKGTWQPKQIFSGRDVLLLGTGPGVEQHHEALEHFIKNKNPLVLALNTQSAINSELIDLRIACHPVRLLADCDAHIRLPQPLITPYSMLPENICSALKEKEVLDFGLNINPDGFKFFDSHCSTPTQLVMAYAFAVITSGQAKRIIMAGFDGYTGEDPRNIEMNSVVTSYKQATESIPMISITPTRYDIQQKSIYGTNI